MIAKTQFRDNIHAYQIQFNPKPVLVFIFLGQDKALFWIYIYIRLKYDHKKSSTDTPTMIYTKHILKTKWRNFCQVLLKEWCKIQSIIFLPNFNYTLKSLKKKYRCLKTTDFNRLHKPHYDWNFSIPSKSYRILQKLGMSILNNQTESASIQASPWRLYAGIVVNYYQNGL